MPVASLSKRISILQDRANMLAKARLFFSKRSVTEVDCPLLCRSGSPDPHIDLFSLNFNEKTYVLHSSPEYGMKRLLCEGMGDIFQLSHVFRLGESGQKHNPEFTMVEWYRLGFTLEKMIQETIDFISLFLGKHPYTIYTFQQAFKTFLES